MLIYLTFYIKDLSMSDAYLSYINYMQGTFYYETFDCSYEAYISKLTDELSMNHSNL